MLATVRFARRSADLSDAARGELERFARDAKAQRLSRIALWAGANNDDPVEGGKLAFARALAVHAFLIDQGIRANIELGRLPDPPTVALDRVDVLAPP